jgi:hypothetical protein
MLQIFTELNINTKVLETDTQGTILPFILGSVSPNGFEDLL